MKGTALKPDFFMSSMPSMVADKKAREKGVTKEERQLYAMSNSTGWQVLKGYINNVIEDLNKINEAAIEKGATFDVIGQNAVVINLARALIRRILVKVEDAKEACEKPDGTAT
jgi:hypothetical protein